MSAEARALVAARFPQLAADTIATAPMAGSSTRSSVKRTHSVAAGVASHSSSKRSSTTRRGPGAAEVRAAVSMILRVMTIPGVLQMRRRSYRARMTLRHRSSDDGTVTSTPTHVKTRTNAHNDTHTRQAS